MPELSPLAKNALETLATIVTNREKLDQLEYLKVRDARIHGASWRAISIVLGTTEPTLQTRFARYEAKWAGQAYKDGRFQPVGEGSGK